MNEVTVSSTRETSGGPPRLKLVDVTKRFGQNTVLKDVTLDIQPNEVVGLIGENGAGKSTLLKILTGIYRSDSGAIELDGVSRVFNNPKDATDAGIGVVHQEQSLLTNLSVAENMIVASKNKVGTRFGFYNWPRLNREAEQALARVRADIDPKAIVGDLSFVDRQMVEIARALRVVDRVGVKPLVILDEPTAVLEKDEAEVLQEEILHLKTIGSVIFVSHRLDEIMHVCDRVIVMRDGNVVAERRTDDVTEAELFQLMIGHEAQAKVGPVGATSADAGLVMETKGLTKRGDFDDVSLDIRAGRCTAIVGTVGSGREQLCRALFGAEPFSSGALRVGGEDMHSWTIAKSIREGIAYVPAERKVESIVGDMSAMENLTLSHPRTVTSGPVVNGKKQRALAAEWFELLDVRPNEPKKPLGRFSGGNQQKVVMAKWLLDDNLSLLVLDHPLRGLDPGAAEAVNDQIRQALVRGVAVLLIPDTIEEALELGDDVLVMRDGVVTARFDQSEQSVRAIDVLEKMV